MGLKELLTEYEAFIETSINAGWMYKSKSEMLEQPITLIYGADEFLEDDFISYVIPEGNAFFDSPNFNNADITAFRFNNDDLLWFCNIENSTIYSASTWVNNSEPITDIYFGKNYALNTLEDINELIINRENKAAINFSSTHMEYEKLEQANSDDIVFFAEGFQIDNSDNGVKFIYVADINKKDVLFSFGLTNADFKDATKIKAFFEPYKLNDKDVLINAANYYSLYLTAKKLIQ